MGREKAVIQGRKVVFNPDKIEIIVSEGENLLRAAMQAGAILLSRQFTALDNKIPVAAKMNDVRFKRIVRPGELIRMEVELVERMADIFFLKAKVIVEDKTAVRFDFACTAADKI